MLMLTKQTKQMSPVILVKLVAHPSFYAPAIICRNFTTCHYLP